MNKQISNLITSIIFLAVFASVLFLVNSANESGKDDIYKIRKEIKSGDVLPKPEDLLGQISEIKNKKNLLSSYLIDKDNPVVFIEKIEDVIGLYAVSAEVGKVEKTEEGLIMDVVIKGENFEVRKVLKHIENLDKEVYVQTLRLSKNSPEEGKEIETSTMFLSIIGKSI